VCHRRTVETVRCWLHGAWLGIASDRLYLFGFSNGGQMSFRLMAQLPGRFSGVVLVGAQLPTPGKYAMHL
jgi:poly(3-hydroxybutyrate) depolymerase